MFKQIACCLLLVAMGSVSLVANDTATFYDCTAVPPSELSTSEIESTSVRLSYPEPVGVTINQFRVRVIGTSAWKYSNILVDGSRFFENLEPSTEYEFQVSYICPNGSWTSFSKSAYFTTTSNSSSEEESMEVEPVQVDTMLVDTIQSDTIKRDYFLLGSSYATCGDSIVCIPLQVVAANGRISTDLLWESHILEFQTIQLRDTFNSSLYYQEDSASLENGLLSINFINSNPDYFEEGDTLDLGSLCFIPSFDQAPTAAIEFGSSEMLEKNDDLSIDTTVLIQPQQGTIDLHACDGIELGGGNCITIDGVGLTTSSVRETHTYIHNSHHNEAYKNQFRYREKGEINWLYTEVDTKYFRQIFDLLPGTTYEFQANQECRIDGSFSDYSISHYFTTLGEGEATNDSNRETEEEEAPIVVDVTCEPVDSTELEVSTIKQYFAYVYTPQPYGPINNQFRYRIVGSAFWFYTSISPTYYRWLRNLTDGTLYEYQVSHECSEGVWSPYSGSYQFETLISVNLQGASSSRAILENAPTNISKQEVSVNVFPSPSSDWITVVRSGGEETTQARLLDLKGKVLQKITLSNSTRVNIRNYPKGIYILEVKSQDGFKQVKLLKQ